MTTLLEEAFAKAAALPAGGSTGNVRAQGHPQIPVEQKKSIRSAQHCYFIPTGGLLHRGRAPWRVSSPFPPDVTRDAGAPWAWGAKSQSPAPSP